MAKEALDKRVQKIMRFHGYDGSCTYRGEFLYYHGVLMKTYLFPNFHWKYNSDDYKPNRSIQITPHRIRYQWYITGKPEYTIWFAAPYTDDFHVPSNALEFDRFLINNLATDDNEFIRFVEQAEAYQLHRTGKPLMPQPKIIKGDIKVPIQPHFAGDYRLEYDGKYVTLFGKDRGYDLEGMFGAPKGTYEEMVLIPVVIERRNAFPKIVEVTDTHIFIELNPTPTF